MSWGKRGKTTCGPAVLLAYLEGVGHHGWQPQIASPALPWSLTTSDFLHTRAARSSFLQQHPGMGRARPPSPSGEMFVETIHTSAGGREGGSLSFLLQKETCIIVLFCSLWGSENEGEAEGRYLPIKNKWFRPDFLRLETYGWKNSWEKKNPPETEFPFDRNLSKGVLTGGL